MNILIVEDEAPVARLLERMLESWGHECDCAATAAAAVRKFESAVYDLVILDIFLPDAEGHTLIPGFKAAHPDVVIIAMTGFNTRELELNVRKAGVAVYMLKPIETAALKSVIEHMAARLENRDAAENG